VPRRECRGWRVRLQERALVKLTDQFRGAVGCLPEPGSVRCAPGNQNGVLVSDDVLVGVPTKAANRSEPDGVRLGPGSQLLAELWIEVTVDNGVSAPRTGLLDQHPDLRLWRRPRQWFTSRNRPSRAEVGVGKRFDHRARPGRQLRRWVEVLGLRCRLVEYLVPEDRQEHHWRRPREPGWLRPTPRAGHLHP